MGGTRSTAHLDFIEKMENLLGAMFTKTVPAVTQRSNELMPQHGLIIGGTPSLRDLDGLAAYLTKLADIDAWSVNDPTALLSTFTFATESNDASPAMLPALDNVMSRNAHHDDASAHYAIRSHEPRLTKPRLLASQDEIILACEPNGDAFALRQMALAQLPLNGPLTHRSYWGSELRLAFAKRPLTDDERDATNLWLAEAAQYLPDSILLTRVIAALFSAGDDRYSLDAKHSYTLSLNF